MQARKPSGLFVYPCRTCAGSIPAEGFSVH
nr:MAG TPA_asm: zinc finger protein [Bacteriophage sp.]